MKISVLITNLFLVVNISAQSFVGAFYNGSLHSGGGELIETSTHEYLLSSSNFTHLGFNIGNELTKLDSNGNILWQRLYAAPCYGDATFYYLRELSNGNYLTAGAGTSDCLADFFQYSFISVFDTSGNELWKNCLDSCQYHFTVRDAIGDLDGGVTLIGEKDSNLIITSVLMRFDSLGNIISKREYLPSFGLIGNDYEKIVQAEDTTYFICGYLQYMPYIFHLAHNGDSLTSISLNDSLVVNEEAYIKDFKLSGDSLITCVQNIDTSGSPSLTNEYFFETNTTTFITIQTLTSGVSYFYPQPNGGKIVLTICPNNLSEWNIKFERRDAPGNILWEYCLDPRYSVLGGLRFNTSSDGGILYACALDTFNTGNYQSVYYIKIDSSGTVLNIYEPPSPAFEVFPNPADDKIFIRGPIEKLQEIYITDMLGRRYLSANFDFESGIDVSMLKQGLYFINLKTSDSKGSFIKFVKQ